MKWQTIRINLNNIERRNNSFVIRMPKKSEYKGCSFWHPAKLTSIKKRYAEIICTEEWEFSFYRNGKRTKGTAEDVKEAFSSLQAADRYETHVPEKLDAERVEIPGELIDG